MRGAQQKFAVVFCEDQSFLAVGRARLDRVVLAEPLALFIQLSADESLLSVLLSRFNQCLSRFLSVLDQAVFECHEPVFSLLILFLLH